MDKRLDNPIVQKALAELASASTWASALPPVLVASSATLALHSLHPLHAQAPVALDLRTICAWVLMLLAAIVLQVALAILAPRFLKRLPLEELTFGILVGGAITCLTYLALTMSFSPALITVCAVPLITCALIVQTGNNCTIQRDLSARRQTLPTLLGLDLSARVTKTLVRATIVYMVLWVIAFDVIIWRSLALLVVAGLLAIALNFLLKPLLRRIDQAHYSPQSRPRMMQDITLFSAVINLSWIVILLLCWLVGDLYFFL